MPRDLLSLTLDEAVTVACPVCGSAVGAPCLPDLTKGRDVRRLAETLSDPNAALSRTHLARLRAAAGMDA